jgi:hypothetical protein
MPINKYVRPIRQRLIAKQKIRIEFNKQYYIFILNSRRMKVTKDDAIKMADWIMATCQSSHGKNEYK